MTVSHSFRGYELPSTKCGVGVIMARLCTSMCSGGGRVRFGLHGDVVAELGIAIGQTRLSVSQFPVCKMGPGKPPTQV